MAAGHRDLCAHCRAQLPTPQWPLCGQVLGARALQWSQKTFLRSPLGPHERPQSETRRKPTPSTGKVFQKNLSKTKVFQKKPSKKKGKRQNAFRGKVVNFFKNGLGLSFFKKSGACGAAGACGFRILNLKHQTQYLGNDCYFLTFFFFFRFFFDRGGNGSRRPC